jgi:hypothetical protein
MLINLIISVQTCTKVLLDIRVVEPAGLHGAVREVAVHDLALPVQVPLQQGRTSAAIKRRPLEKMRDRVKDHLALSVQVPLQQRRTSATS